MFSSISYKQLASMFALVALGLIVPCKVFAQVDTGSISGTIKDTSGGVIPGVKVTVANESTGQSLSTTSGSVGEYIFSPLRIGRYSVSAEIQDFQKVQQNNVTVDVQQKVVIDFALAPGQTTQTVMVNAEPPTLQTQDASVGQVIGERNVDALPLNGRNFTFLAQLSAGVTQGQQDTRGLGASGSFAANGLRPAQNNYLLDGIDNNVELVDFLNGTHFVVRPAVDAIQEFKIQTNSFSAESPTSLKIQEEFERGNTARTNLVDQSEALYLFPMFMTAGIKHSSFSTTKPRVSGRLSPIFPPFQPPSNDRADTPISRSFSPRAARKRTCSAAPRHWVRFLTPRPLGALPAVCRTPFLG